MPVSSCIIRCRAELLPRVREALCRLPGVTLGPAGAPGTFGLSRAFPPFIFPSSISSQRL